MPIYEKKSQDLCFRVYIRPRASKDEIVGQHGDCLKIRLTAPAVEGKANQALIKFLAKKLAVPKSAIQIISGERNRTKLIKIKGLKPEDFKLI
jgi:uncharacterized protein (TIGR00251 family)